MVSPRSVYLALIVLVLGFLPVPGLAEGTDEADRQAAEREKSEQLAVSKLDATLERAYTLKDMGKIDDAIAAFRKVLDFQVPADFSADRKKDLAWQKIHVGWDLAELYREGKKDPTTALSYLKDALALVDTLPADDTEVKTKKVEINKHLASILREMGKPEEALKHLQAAEEIE